MNANPVSQPHVMPQISLSIDLQCQRSQYLSARYALVLGPGLRYLHVLGHFHLLLRGAVVLYRQDDGIAVEHDDRDVTIGAVPCEHLTRFTNAPHDPETIDAGTSNGVCANLLGNGHMKIVSISS